jgi:Domain of unknown function (DUF4148)
MNTIKYVAIAFALLGNAAAFAQEGTQDFANLPASSRTRAEVKAELAKAQAQGLLDNRGETYGSLDIRKFESTRSRADVLAELDIARRAGELDRRNYAYGSFARSDIASTRSRAEVKAELVQALASGSRLSQGERNGG